VGVTPTSASASTSEAVEAVFRIESARIIARVARIVRDVGIAEELAQDALMAALVQWPESDIELRADILKQRITGAHHEGPRRVVRHFEQSFSLHETHLSASLLQNDFDG